jgi:hypothetical protein
MADSNRTNGKNNHSVFAILDKHTKNSDKTSPLQAEENFVVLDEFQTTSQRCDLFTLEYPIFSLSRIPNKEPFSAGQFTISPNSMQGQPTMYDKELLIYVISKTDGRAKPRASQWDRTVRFTGYDFLKFTGKDVGGIQYQRLHQSLNRIAFCGIERVQKSR